MIIYPETRWISPRMGMGTSSLAVSTVIAGFFGVAAALLGTVEMGMIKFGEDVIYPAW